MCDRAMIVSSASGARKSGHPYTHTHIHTQDSRHRLYTFHKN